MAKVSYRRGEDNILKLCHGYAEIRGSYKLSVITKQHTSPNE